MPAATSLISSQVKPTPATANPAAMPGLAQKITRLRRWLLGYPRAIPIAIFLAIAAITALSVYSIEVAARERQQAQMRSDAQSIASALERRAASFTSYLRAGSALFSNVDQVTPEIFREFVSELRLNVDYKGSEGLGWIEVVPRGGEAEYLARIRSQQPGFPEIRPKPGASLPRLAIATYVAPETDRTRRALGFNLYSEQVRAAAMDEARRAVTPTASGRIAILQEDSGEADGFAIFMPVFSGAPSLRDDEPSLAGFVYSPFNAENFLAAAIDRAAPEELGVHLYDGPRETENLLATRPLKDPATSRIEQAIAIANRDFLLVVEADAPMVLSPLSMVTLLFGLALASLLMLLARLLTQQAHEDQERLAFFEEQHSIRNSLTRELNHRVKNTLANVLSILSLTRRRSSDLNQFADSLEGRIRSLSATHDLLTGSDWSTTPMRAVIDAEMQHQRANPDTTVTISGPPVELAPNDALSFGLAIHELTTNAAKYGALSVRGGEVHIEWQLLGDHLAEVSWTETGGPAVAQRCKRGFGTELIEKIVAHELKQPVVLEFDQGGVRCVIRVPVRRRSEFQIRETAANDAA